MLILHDVTRFVGFSCRLEQEVVSLVFDPMLSLLGGFSLSQITVI